MGTTLVKMVCVVYNQNQKEIAMFYQSETELNLGEFRKRMLQFVPKYMLPTKYFRLDEVPLSANGKIDRLKLQKELLNG